MKGTGEIMQPWRGFRPARRLSIDYVAPRSDKRMIVGLLGMAGLAWLGVLFGYEQESKAVDLLREAAHYMPLSPGLPPAQQLGHTIAITPLEMRQIEEISRQLQLPWEDVFGGVQRAATVRVALLEVVPEPETRSLRVVAEARRANDIWDYMTRLSRQPGFGQVVLKEHELRQDQPQQPIRFTLALKW